MIRLRRLFSLFGIVPALAAALAIGSAPTAHANGTVQNVYVFNGGNNNQGKPGNAFDNGAQGYIFQQMGLLNGDGAPPTQTGDNLMQGANVVGKVLRDGNNNVIGYESADGKSRAYNLDTSATMTQAWNAVANGGSVHICKHGITGGGGITLDGGTAYDGFKPVGGAGNGTGAGNPGGAYPLPPRPGAGITMDCNGCFTTLDPPGAPGSVTGSAGGVPGVGGTSGHARKVYKGPDIGITGPDQASVDAAVAALDACAKAKGYTKDDGSGDGADYISKLPMKDQLSTARACIAGTGATLTISYAKSETETGNGCTSAGCYYEAIQLITSSGGVLHYEASPPHALIHVQIPPGSVSSPTPIFLSPTIIDTPLPPGTQPATYPVSLGIYGSAAPQLFFNNPVFMQLSYPPLDPVIGFYEVLPNGQLVQMPAQINAGQIQATLDHGGVYVALGPGGGPAIPALSDIGLVLLAAVLGLAGMLVLRARAA